MKANATENGPSNGKNGNQDQLLKSQYGTVKPYTRHVKKCEAKDNSCTCSKWLYVHPCNGPRLRYTLNTPSWAEALERAADKLKELDPEIAAIRQKTAKQERERKTVFEAINLWLDRTRALYGERATIVNQYRSTFGWVDKDGVKHGALLRYAAYKRFDYIDEFTPLVLQEWLASDQFPGKELTSKHQRWGTVRSFFNFLHELGVLESNPAKTIKAPPAAKVFAHAPYTDEQYNAILEQADWYVDERVRNGERDIYCQRMHNFLELLRHTGMDLVDAVLLRPSQQIQDTKIDGTVQSVLRYRRQKTGVEAVIPLERKVAAKLRATPMAPKSVDGLPFRYQGNDIKSDVHNWGRRIGALVKLAGITTIPLMNQDGTPALDRFGNRQTTTPDAKMFRHTFAVGELVKGVPEEVVAKMLGHKGTDMLRKHYGPWCKERDEAHIRAVVASRNGGTKSKAKGSR